MARVNVTDEIADSIVKHSVQLQRLANGADLKIVGQLKKLSNELLAIATDLDADFSNTKIKKALRLKRRHALERRGSIAIAKAYELINKGIEKNLFNVAALEDAFAVTSINKAVTGKGTIKFALSMTDLDQKKKLTQIASKQIINGAPQKALFRRQLKAFQQKFTDGVNQAWMNNETIGDLSNRIRGTQAQGFRDGIIRTSQNQAKTLSRTLISSVANQTRQESYLNNSDVVSGVQFLAVLDGKTTPVCQSLAGKTWKIKNGGYVPQNGAPDFRVPPIHFNCRSTTTPIVFSPSQLSARKLKMVKKSKVDGLGKLADSKGKYKNIDSWLKTQGVPTQKEFLGAGFGLWTAGKVSAARFIPQSGRFRTFEQLKKHYQADDLIPQTDAGKLKPFKTQDGANADAIKDITRGDFEDIQNRVLSGRVKKLTDAEQKKLDAVFRNADKRQLEFADDFKPIDFKDIVGTSEKRRAFLNHIAVRFQRDPGLGKGDLKNRRTSNLSAVDKKLFDNLRDKIRADTSLTRADKRILLDLLEDGGQIVGTQRIIPTVEALRALARKGKLGDVDNFNAFLHGTLRNKVNDYFSRVIALEETLPGAATRYKFLKDASARAKGFYLDDAKGASTVKLKDTNKVARSVENVSKKGLRDFAGETPSLKSIDLELNGLSSVEFFLKNVSGVRMDARAMKAWARRVNPKKTSLHKERIDFILKNTRPGEPVIITETMLKSKLFKGWEKGIWDGKTKGLSPALRKEIGDVLGDAQIYQDLRHYLSTKLKFTTGVNPDIDIENAIKAFFNSGRKGSTIAVTERKIDRLANLDKDKTARLIAARDKKVHDRVHAGLSEADLAAHRAKEAKLKGQREVTRTDRAILSGTVEQKKIIKGLEDNYRKAITDKNSPLFDQAILTGTDDLNDLADLVNRHVYAGVKHGSDLTSTARKLGSDYYSKFKGLVLTDNIEDTAMSIRMGNYLILAMEQQGFIRRIRRIQTVKIDGRAPTTRYSWGLETKNKSWKQSIDIEKSVTGIDGLPNMGKGNLPEFDFKTGTFKGGAPIIRGADREWLIKQLAKPGAKDWVNPNLIEGATGWNVNLPVLQMMKEMERRGKSIIPKPPKGKLDVEARSRYDSYLKARDTADATKSQTFYNPIANDRYARGYANTKTLHAQGDDIQRGLMRFEKGVPLGKDGMEAFERVFMNLAGFDKIPIATLRRLYHQIPDEFITAAVRNPGKNDWWFTKNDWLDKGIFKKGWQKAVDPADAEAFFKATGKHLVDEIANLARTANPEGEGAFQFWAMMEERARLTAHIKAGNKADTFVSHLPGQYDGTTNVFQHMAAISKDPSIAKAANMFKSRVIEDAYIKLRDSMDTFGKGLSKDDPLAALFDMKLTHAKRRKTVKKALMTAQYNAGPQTLGESFIQALRVDFPDIAKNLSNREIKRLGHEILRRSDEIFPGAARVRRALNELAESQQIAGKGAIEVKIPGSNFPFRQAYKQHDTIKMKVVGPDGKLHSLSVNIELDVVDFLKQRIAFAPNIIHAMDATHKALVVKRLKELGVTNFSMIHDSFGASMGQMKLLERVTQEVFVEMYGKGSFLRYLEKQLRDGGPSLRRYVRDKNGKKIKNDAGEFKTEVIDLDGVNFQQGTYDVSNVIGSPFFH